MTDFIARRDGSDFLLFADGIQFGRLADCETTHVFVCEDEQLAQHVYIEGDYSIREMLAAVRAGYEAYEAEISAEAKSEREAEAAWLHHAELYDHEAQEDLALHDALSAY